MSNGKVTQKIVDWKIIEQERTLMSNQCLDGEPGLSDNEFERLSLNDKNAQALYQEYQKKYKGYPVVGLLWRFADFFYIAGDNMRNALTAILQSNHEGALDLRIKLNWTNNWRGEHKDRDTVVGSLGRYLFPASNQLNSEDQKKLVDFIIQEFNKKGVHFKKGDIEVEMIKMKIGEVETNMYSINFPLASCKRMNV